MKHQVYSLYLNGCLQILHSDVKFYIFLVYGRNFELQIEDCTGLDFHSLSRNLEALKDCFGSVVDLLAPTGHGPTSTTLFP